MADGSRLPDDENLAFTTAVAQELRPLGIAVEAELGRVEGDEDLAALAAAGALTDPDEAAAFVRSSGVDCLAVSIGNVHGHYASTPALDWERLERLRGAGAPLSLHGASGAAGRRRAPGGVAGDRQGQRQHRAARGLLRRAGLRGVATRAEALDLRGLGKR